MVYVLVIFLIFLIFLILILLGVAILSASLPRKAQGKPIGAMAGLWLLTVIWFSQTNEMLASILNGFGLSELEFYFLSAFIGVSALAIWVLLKVFAARPKD